MSFAYRSNFTATRPKRKALIRDLSSVAARPPPPSGSGKPCRSVHHGCTTDPCTAPSCRTTSPVTSTPLSTGPPMLQIHKGLYSSELNESMISSWTIAVKFRDEIYSMTLKVGSDGRRLPALKFVESVVLLCTPNPNGSLEPPSDEISEGKFEEFNASWLRGGYPILIVRDLSAEASKSLGLLLDHLRFPFLRSHNYLVIVVLIRSLSALATKRPAFYGRILPVLLGLDSSSSAGKGMQLAGVHHALKNAFESCLNCSHPGAAPWRESLVSALKEIKVGRPIEQAANEISDNSGKAEWTTGSHMAQVYGDEKPAIALVTENRNSNRKRAGMLSTPEFAEDDMVAKRARLTSDNSECPGNAMSEGQLKCEDLFV